MKNVIEIKDLSVYYGNLCALSNININIKEKEFLAIMGPNGGGKSSLLKSILGLITPNKGSVNIMSNSPKEAKGLIGYVPQFSKFDKSFPINVNDVVLSATLANKNPFFHKYSKSDRKKADNILESLNIIHLKNRQIGQLSGGQLQRVLIARALTLDPKILLLDEPTASLDAQSKTQIYSILKELNKDMTILLVTHDMEAVCSHVDSIACVNKTLHYHGKAQLNDTIVHQVYGCPVDLIAHGVPHRILDVHKEAQ